MADTIAMETDDALVEIAPQLGGSIAAFDLKRGTERVPIFRRWEKASDNPRALASSPMVPWFNRISGGGFTFGGKFYPVEPNDPLEPVPLHGDGWYSPWEVVEKKRNHVVLRLRSRAIPPFDYEATQTLSLDGASLVMDLSLRHLGNVPLPYGLGQHPWFVRTPETTLHANATGMWLEQPPEFPPKTEPAQIPDKWNFNTPRALPDEFIDNGYVGWDGRAQIIWADRDVAVDIESDSATRYYHVYAPKKELPFFCFEPVTHPNNALGKPGTPEANGLRVLAPGASTSMHFRVNAKSL